MTHYPTLADVQAAAARIKPYVHRTPVLTCTSLNDLVGAALFRVTYEASLHDLARQVRQLEASDPGLRSVRVAFR